MFRPAGTATVREGAAQPSPSEDRRSRRTRVSLEGEGQPVALCRQCDVVAAAVARLAAPVLARQGFLRRRPVPMGSSRRGAFILREWSSRPTGLDPSYARDSRPICAEPADLGR